MVRSFAVKPVDPALFLSTDEPVVPPCLPAARPDPEGSAHAFNAPTLHSYPEPFQARWRPARPPGFRADEPSTRCLDRLGGVSVRNPFGIDRRGLQTHSRRTGEG